MGDRVAIFLDRDGTLNRKAPEGDYIRNAQDLELIPGAASAVGRINNHGIPVVLITNQRWVSLRKENAAAYSAVERELARLLAADGAYLDACYTCPHAADSCDCRKPAPGLLLRAASDLGISLSASFVIGDTETDMRAGLAVGATTVLVGVRPGTSGQRADAEIMPHFAAADIGGAVDWVISQMADRN